MVMIQRDVPRPSFFFFFLMHFQFIKLEKAFEEIYISKEERLCNYKCSIGIACRKTIKGCGSGHSHLKYRGGWSQLGYQLCCDSAVIYSEVPPFTVDLLGVVFKHSEREKRLWTLHCFNSPLSLSLYLSLYLSLSPLLSPAHYLFLQK